MKYINKLIGAIQGCIHVEKVHRANGFKPSKIKDIVDLFITMLKF